MREAPPTPRTQVNEKLAAKAEFGFSAVPFCVVFGADGTVLHRGDPNAIDFSTIFNAPAAIEAVTPPVTRSPWRPPTRADLLPAPAKRVRAGDQMH